MTLGIATVQYQLHKYLPNDSLLLILCIFNHISLTQEFPTSCMTAIIPIPKLGKVFSERGRYRAIVLTRSLYKVMHCLINSRLTWNLERVYYQVSKKISKMQFYCTESCDFGNFN